MAKIGVEICNGCGRIMKIFKSDGTELENFLLRDRCCVYSTLRQNKSCVLESSTIRWNKPNF